MMTQLDELESDKFLNMSFVEFLEALVRVAEKLEIPHLVDVSYTRLVYLLRTKRCFRRIYNQR